MARSRVDVTLLFTTRIARLFAYGFLSVVLVLYLAAVGLQPGQIGLLLTLTLVGDAFVSLWLTTSADRFGRRRTLRIGALLMIGAGVAFVLTRQPLLLMIAAIVGVISPSGNEIGPFLSIEQAALSQLVADKQRTQIFAWYNMVGSFATAFGALTRWPDGPGAARRRLVGAGRLPSGHRRLRRLGRVVAAGLRMSSRPP